MAKDVIMPVLGMNQDTAVLLSWLKQEGETVEEGEPIMEVETDKATMELDAPASGTLAGVRAAAGDEVKVGSVIAVILGEGEAAPAGAQAPAAERPAGRSAGEAASDGQARTPAAGGATSAAPSPEAAARNPVGSGTADGPPRAGLAMSGATSGLVPASPKARRLAGERGVGLEALRGRGGGPDGAVLAADVLAAARRAEARPPAAATQAAALRFERTLAAEGLLATLAWARGRPGSDAATHDVAIGDLVARFLAAVWTRQPLADAGQEATLRYRRLEDGRLSDVRLSLSEASSLSAVARARADAPAADAPSGAEPADVALLDLSAGRADLAADSFAPTGAVLDVLVGRLDERVLAIDGAPAVARGLTLLFAFDPARTDLAAAASFCDRVLALVEEPASLALLY